MIKRRKIADDVLKEIKTLILKGKLKKGDKLPNQAEFAAQLGVSRPSLREAISKLSIVGAIEQRPGFGTVLLSEQRVFFTDHLTLDLVHDNDATIELLECRRMIETSLVELAVKNASDEEIENLGKLISDMRLALDEGRMEDYIDHDISFHYKIAEAARNRYMLHMLVTMRGLMEQFMQEAFDVLPGAFDKSMRKHEDIYNALKSRNVKKAVRSMDQHIAVINNDIQTYYFEGKK